MCAFYATFTNDMSIKFRSCCATVSLVTQTDGRTATRKLNVDFVSLVISRGYISELNECVPSATSRRAFVE